MIGIVIRYLNQNAMIRRLEKSMQKITTVNIHTKAIKKIFCWFWTYLWNLERNILALQYKFRTLLFISKSSSRLLQILTPRYLI